MTIEERLEQLETFIGNIDQISLYANSLQELVDKYMSPLYIETGSRHVLHVSDYLGDLNNIPRNIVFKIRASHLLSVDEGEAILRFSRQGQEPTDFPLKKYSDGLLVALTSGNYIPGVIYDVYINSQDIAIITSNDLAALAVSEINTIGDRVGELEAKTDSLEVGDGGALVLPNLEAHTLSVTNAEVKGSLTFGSSASAIILPGESTITSGASTNNSIMNRQATLSLIQSEFENSFQASHLVGTSSATTALQDKPDGTFYFKLEK